MERRDFLKGLGVILAGTCVSGVAGDSVKKEIDIFTCDHIEIVGKDASGKDIRMDMNGNGVVDRNDAAGPHETEFGTDSEITIVANVYGYSGKSINLTIVNGEDEKVLRHRENRVASDRYSVTYTVKPGKLAPGNYSVSVVDDGWLSKDATYKFSVSNESTAAIRERGRKKRRDDLEAGVQEVRAQFFKDFGYGKTGKKE